MEEIKMQIIPVAILHASAEQLQFENEWSRRKSAVISLILHVLILSSVSNSKIYQSGQ